MADPACTAAASEARVERAPPGYADPEPRARSASQPGVPLFWFLLLLAAVSTAAVHELAATQPEAYLVAGFASPRWLSTAAGLSGLALGALAVRRFRAPLWLLPWLLAAASLIVTSSGYVWFFAFGHSELPVTVALAVPALGSGLVGAALALAARGLARAALALGVLERALRPLRLGALALVFGGLAAAATAVGLLRSAATIGLFLSVLALWSVALVAYLEQRPLARSGGARRLSAVALLAGFAALLGAEAVVPSEELGRYDNRIVYFSRSDRARYAVTSGQDAFELFIDGRLALSGIDQERYHQALVHPAMLAAPRRARVLVLGQGHGSTLRELFRHPDVEHVTLVVPDAALPALSERVAWLRQLAGGAFGRAELDVIEAEPAVYLSEPRGPFDVAIVDLPDPNGYLDAKNYTRHFYRRLSAALGADGVIGLQATSAFGSPRTFATIEHTLEAAELSTLAYRAAVPTFGDWGFVLASRRPIAPPRAELDRFLSGTTRLEAFVLPRDMRTPAEGEISTLHDPRVVHVFANERERLGL